MDNKLDLQGHFLIAMPGMNDPRFDRSVIYMCSHSGAGAMGLIINKPHDDISLEEIIEQLIDQDGSIDQLNASVNRNDLIFHGGPVEQGRGFVLHSAEYELESTQKVAEGVSLTASIDILRDIARGNGPQNALLTLGYAGWSAGQLEAEMAQNGWLSCKATTDILFDENFEKKYDRALALMGIDSTLLSAEAGHA